MLTGAPATKVPSVAGTNWSWLSQAVVPSVSETAWTPVAVLVVQDTNARPEKIIGSLAPPWTSADHTWWSPDTLAVVMVVSVGFDRVCPPSAPACSQQPEQAARATATARRGRRRPAARTSG